MYWKRRTKKTGLLNYEHYSSRNHHLIYSISFNLHFIPFSSTMHWQYNISLAVDPLDIAGATHYYVFVAINRENVFRCPKGTRGASEDSVLLAPVTVHFSWTPLPSFIPLILSLLSHPIPPSFYPHHTWWAVWVPSRFIAWCCRRTECHSALHSTVLACACVCLCVTKRVKYHNRACMHVQNVCVHLCRRMLNTMRL